MTAKKPAPRSPIRWLGGKGRKKTKILPFFPPHRIYVEPFGGGASLLLAKQPAEVEVYNDVDSGLVCLFRVLRNPQKFARFYEKVCWTPYSREEYEYCRETWESCDDEIEKAYRFFVIARQSFGGKAYSGWGRAITESQRGMAAVVSRWLTAVLADYDTPETLFYCDPPYVPSTRRGGRYRYEMTLEDHRELVEILLSLSGMVVLSGYQHNVYSPLDDAGWRRVDFQTSADVAGRVRGSTLQGLGAATKNAARVESIWISPTAQQRLEERETQ